MSSTGDTRKRQRLPDGWQCKWSSREERWYYWETASPWITAWELPSIDDNYESDSDHLSGGNKRSRRINDEASASPLSSSSSSSYDRPPKLKGPASDASLIQFNSSWSASTTTVLPMKFIYKQDMHQVLNDNHILPLVIINIIVNDYWYDQTSALFYRPPLPLTFTKPHETKSANRGDYQTRLRKAYPDIKSIAQYMNQPEEVKKQVMYHYHQALKWIEPDYSSSSSTITDDGKCRELNDAVHVLVVECKTIDEALPVLRQIIKDIMPWKDITDPTYCDNPSVTSVASSSTSPSTSPSNDRSLFICSPPTQPPMPPMDINAFGIGVAWAFDDMLRKHLTSAELEELDYQYLNYVDLAMTNEWVSDSALRQVWTGKFSNSVSDKEVEWESVTHEDSWQYMNPIHCLIRWAYRIGSCSRSSSMLQWITLCAKHLVLFNPSGSSTARTLLLRKLWIKTIAFALANIMNYKEQLIGSSADYTNMEMIMLYVFTSLYDAPSREVRDHGSFYYIACYR
jgi:hypothetical protein